MRSSQRTTGFTIPRITAGLYDGIFDGVRYTIALVGSSWSLYVAKPPDGPRKRVTSSIPQFYEAERRLSLMIERGYRDPKPWSNDDDYLEDTRPRREWSFQKPKKERMGWAKTAKD